MKKALFLTILLLVIVTTSFAGIFSVGGVGSGVSKTLDGSCTSGSDYASINSTYSGYSQSYQSGGGTIDSILYYMYRDSGASGEMKAKIYTHTGSYGTTSKPDTLIASSTGRDASILDVGVENVKEIEFKFEGTERKSLTASTYYVITIEYSGGTTIKVRQDHSGTGHSGNEAYKEGSTWTEEAYDNTFKVYVYR